MGQYTRRSFLKGTIQVAGLSLLPSSLLMGAELSGNGHSQSTHKYLVLGDTAYKNLDLSYSKAISKSVAGKVQLYNQVTGRLTSIESPIFCHGFAQWPQNRNIIVGVEKWTDGSVVIDVKAKKVLQLIQAPKGYRFFGHACFSPQGDQLFATAVSDKDNNGSLLIFKTSDWSFIGTQNLGTHRVHELQLSPDKPELYITGTSNSKNKEMGDFMTYSLSEKKVVQLQNVQGGVSHLLEIEPHTYATGGHTGVNYPKYFTPTLYILNLKTKEVISFSKAKGLPKKMFGQVLSIAKYDQDNLIFTIPEMNSFMLWDWKKNEVVVEKMKGAAWGAALLGQDIYINYGNTGELEKFRYSKSSHQLHKISGNEFNIGNGRHMYNMEFDV